MKKKELLLIGYCIPFSFLAMCGDVTFGTMWLYALLIVGMGFLCWGAVKSQSLIALVFGNALSCIVSIACVMVFQTAEWAGYFKPFTATTMVILISAAAFILQFIVWSIATKKRKDKE